MSAEAKGRLTCAFDNETNCDCPLVAGNARYYNGLGKNRDYRDFAYRLGHDNYGVGLITELLRNPNGNYKTSLFPFNIPFGKEMLVLRMEIARRRLDFLLDNESPENIKCKVLRKAIQESGYSAQEYLRYLGENF